MEITTKVNEDVLEGTFTARCPVCHRPQVFAGIGHEKTKVCKHFVREAHGCGGTVLIFEDGK